MKIQIPARDATPAIIGGRPHVFWLESATKAVNSLVGASSNFVGYDHRIQAKFTVLEADSRWAAPQPLALHEAPAIVRQVLRDRLIIRLPAVSSTLGGSSTPGEKTQTPQLSEREGVPENHLEPREGYGLPGPVLPYVHLDVLDRAGGVQDLQALAGDLLTAVDLFRREALALNVHPLYAEWITVDDVLAVYPTSSGAELYANRLSHDGYSVSGTAVHALVARAAVEPRDATKAWQTPLATLPAQTRATIVRQAIPTTEPVGRLGFDLVVEFDRQPILVLASATASRLARLGTGLGSRLSRQLFEKLLPGLLLTSFQEGCVEPALSATPVGTRATLPPTPAGNGRLDVDGPVGTYLREVWLEFPYLIAGHLNGQQKFAAAQRWYHYLFDPTSDAPAADPDRVWRYRGFRRASVQSLREALVNGPALDAYRNDPFNPHAIARLRPGAHKKAVVMRYLDNLIDWGDALFAEFTRESLNEASMLYVLAADILGPRPPQVGDCGEGAIQPRTYEQIEPALGDTSDFLIELELAAPTNVGYWSDANRRGLEAIDKLLLTGDAAVTKRTAVASFAATATTSEPLRAGAEGGNGAGLDAPVPGATGSLWRTAGGTSIGAPRTPGPGGLGPPIAGRREPQDLPERRPGEPVRRGDGRRSRRTQAVRRRHRDPVRLRRARGLPGADAAGTRRRRHPPAAHLGAAGARDRQAGGRQGERCSACRPTRSCSPTGTASRTGSTRSATAWTSPAPGASRRCSRRRSTRCCSCGPARPASRIDDVLSLGSGSVPPYRFTFLIERARQYAHERPGVRERTARRAGEEGRRGARPAADTHELNLLRLRSRALEWEVASATDSVDALAAPARRRGIPARLLRDAAHDLAQRLGAHPADLAPHGLAEPHRRRDDLVRARAIAKSVPNVGSPFAMTYGGVQVGGALGQVAGAVASLAAAAEAVVGLGRSRGDVPTPRRGLAAPAEARRARHAQPRSPDRRGRAAGRDRGPDTRGA